MYRRILVPVVLDHEPNIAAALDVARVLLETGGEIILFHALEEVPGYIAAQLPAGTIERNVEERRAKLEAIAKSAGVRAGTAVAAGQASRAILDHAGEHGIDCVVITSHRPGLHDYLLGSTAARVVRHAACAVHVIR
ncbi:MAG: universal stress protein [Pseudomonadota bacterium]|nr:universal stress protein [Pseudomonadota bacterium]